MPTIDLLQLQQLIQNDTRIPNKQIKQYFYDLIITLWKTLRKGYFFDSQSLLKQLHLIMHKYSNNISNRIVSEILLLECQFWIKRKRSEKMNKSREQLLKYIQQNKESDIDVLVQRYNSLILFDQKIELIESSNNQLTSVISLSNEGKIETAIDKLKQIMNISKELKEIKQILMGKIYLLQPSIKALESFKQIAQCQFLYESHLAKLLFVAGFKALEKLRQNPEEFRQDYDEYQSYLKQNREQQLENKIANLQLTIKQIKNSSTPSEQLKNIEKALSLISSLKCYPSPSIMQLDLYLITISSKINQGNLSDAKKYVQKSKQTAQKIGIYSGSRQSKINYKLALIYQKQKKINQSLVLVQKSINQQFKQKQLQILFDMRDRLNNKVSSLNHSLIEQQQDEIQSITQKVATKNPLPSSNTAGVEQSSEQQQNKQQQQNKSIDFPKPDPSKSNCCILF